MHSNRQDIENQKLSDSGNAPLLVKILFSSEPAIDNIERTQAVLTEFAQKFPYNIAENPQITLASDGTLMEILLSCQNKEELLNLNIELERIAHRYGLRG